MNRGVFSLFHWTLKRDVQLLRTHLVRGTFAGLMLLVLFVAWLQTLSVGAAGLNLFRAICWMNIVVSTLAAISYFSTCVTDESEAGNLGLLKLAGMGGFSILLGKSTSRLISALMLLVVQFPFTLLAITLGGTTLIQIVSAYVAIGAHLILVANLALFFSVYCRTSGRAAFWTAAVLVLFYASWAILGFVAGTRMGGPIAGPLNWRSVNAWIDQWLLFEKQVSVFSRIEASLASTFEGPVLTSHFWYCVIAAVVLFVLACLGFEWSTHRQANPPRAMTRKRRSIFRFLGVPRAWTRAIAWKEFHYLTGGRVMWGLRAILFLLVFVVVYTYSKSSSGVDWTMACPALTYCFLVILGIEIIVYASRILFDESRWGTFPLLLILPMSSRQLVTQKVMGTLLALIPGFVWLGVAAWNYPGPITDVLSDQVYIHFAVNFLLLVHFTVLLSVFVKWAALPCAVCLVFAFNSCCPVMSIGLVLGDLLGGPGSVAIAAITVATYWILLLLPLQVEIVSRVEDAANHDYGS